jgi:hypothetical protein
LRHCVLVVILLDIEDRMQLAQATGIRMAEALSGLQRQYFRNDRLDTRRSSLLVPLRSGSMCPRNLAEVSDLHRAGQEFGITLREFWDEFYLTDREERQNMIEVEPVVIGDAGNILGRWVNISRNAGISTIFRNGR